MEGNLIIRDQYGWSQPDRRRLFLACLTAAQHQAARHGETLTWTEEPDGVTRCRDGRPESRVTWAELARAETLAAADPTPGGRAAALEEATDDAH